jgi:glyoxylase-like metal-dependent hydrolase (beta-lactamase superfamily II)
MKATIKAITVGNWKINCYLITLGDEGWLIDPGDEYERIISVLKLNNFKLKGIVNTHGHFDHIGAVADIKEKYRIPFLIHSKDKQLISQGNLFRKLAGDSTIKKTPAIDEYLENFTHLDLQSKRILVHHTPGHTMGSVCFEIDENLFTGDLFFRENIGRTDLPGGNKELLLTSINYIHEKFIGFHIYPGHGESFVLDESLLKQNKWVS